MWALDKMIHYHQLCFNTFTNDIPQEINSLGVGVPVGDDEYLSILLYADDIVLIPSSENDLQKMLETYNWGQTWE